MMGEIPTVQASHPCRGRSIWVRFPFTELITKPSRITVKRVNMLYIYKDNILAAQALQEMGCTLALTTKSSGYYDYDCEWVPTTFTVLRVEGWKGSGKAFSRFLKRNGLRWYQQEEAERKAAEEAKILEAERIIAAAAEKKAAAENTLLDKVFGRHSGVRTEEEREFLNQLAYEEEWYWQFGE